MGEISDASQVGHQLLRMARLMSAVKHRFVESGAASDQTHYPILFALNNGPKRLTTLADITHTDISTVCRHVARLETDGLVQKVRDPDDHRARLLDLTEDGRHLLSTWTLRRERLLNHLMGGWPEADIAQLASLLGRLADGLTDSLPHLPEIVLASEDTHHQTENV
ncbi:MarR family winged helix-turn-helix transcriptional regulator [Devriesea agamarum]|uniref:MarR family winged helix-turn-helix transcriptional regulator n=1 Tax=Devriesea agamarum TaxID=472569 RepID=UPI00071DD855|nr:MarR family winged helix-turn-helix transcriptional regulator [Devriesea agamarum]